MKSAEAITVIGAGSVGLMSAFYLDQAGYKVSVIDAGPNPTKKYNPLQAGATYSGSDARHVSATETEPWASKSMLGLLDIPTSKNGWLAKDSKEITKNERAWINAFYDVCKQPELQKLYGKQVININNHGKSLWKKLEVSHPYLFVNTKAGNPMVNFFLDQESLDDQTAVEKICNPYCTILSTSDISRRLPCLRKPTLSGTIIGGFEVDGFALHAITLSQNIINYLQNKGVLFSWNEKLIKIEKQDGQLSCLKTDAKRTIVSHHYVISTGVFEDNLIQNVAQSVMGVAGVWITIPNPGMTHPFKIAAPRPTGFINGTVRGKDLLLSGGYGFIGKDPLDINSPGLKGLFNHMEKVISTVFPNHYEQAKKNNSLDRRACVRPGTITGLGIFESIPTHNGKLIIIGGNCAGGFTQAPTIAQAVVDSLTNKKNSMHTIYQTHRSQIISSENEQT